MVIGIGAKNGLVQVCQPLQHRFRLYFGCRYRGNNPVAEQIKRLAETLQGVERLQTGPCILAQDMHQPDYCLGIIVGQDKDTAPLLFKGYFFDVGAELHRFAGALFHEARQFFRRHKADKFHRVSTPPKGIKTPFPALSPASCYHKPGNSSGITCYIYTGFVA